VDKGVERAEPKKSARFFILAHDAVIRTRRAVQSSETLQRLVDDLFFIVRNVDFSWDSFSRNEEKVVRKFWELNGA